MTKTNPNPSTRPLVYGSRAAGLLYLGTELAAEVVDVVERMHGSIAQRPLPFARLLDDRTRGITALVYRAIRQSFAAVSGGTRQLATQLDDWVERSGGDSLDDSWLAVRAAINGVCGDALEAKANPLALPMRVIRRGGMGDSKVLVLFAHGLCLSEQGWQRDDFPEFERWCAEELGARTAHLRYNTGRSIAANGRELADLLENLVDAEGVEQLVLIGHSMGGLLFRSAGHIAQQGNQAWPQIVSHCALLGSPHTGSPWERLGVFANGLLKHSPYTLPLSKLGDLRSAGIQDLRHGHVHAQANDSAGEWLPRARYLMVAASRSLQVPYRVWEAKDDLLVPVASALALTAEGEELLSHPRLQREALAGMDHMQMMGDARLWARVKDWILPPH